MDIVTSIISTGPAVLLSTVIGGGLAVIAWKLADKILFYLISKIDPSRYPIILLNKLSRIVFPIIEKFDDDVIDKMKKKTPETAKEIEKEICEVIDDMIKRLRRLKKIVEDEN